MGVYTEKFRQLIEKLPKTPDQFSGPIEAASAMAQLSNAVLQCLASLEEALEDAQRENEKLQELMLEGTAPKVPLWNPNSK